MKNKNIKIHALLGISNLKKESIIVHVLSLDIFPLKSSNDEQQWRNKNMKTFN